MGHFYQVIGRNQVTEITLSVKDSSVTFYANTNSSKQDKYTKYFTIKKIMRRENNADYFGVIYFEKKSVLTSDKVSEDKNTKNDPIRAHPKPKESLIPLFKLSLLNTALLSSFSCPTYLY